MKPKPFTAQNPDLNDIYSNTHSARFKYPGASTTNRKREIDLIMFNIRENLKPNTKPRPKNINNVNSTSFNGRATPTGRNVNVSIAQSIITQNIYDLNSLAVAQDVQGKEQSTARENDSSASVNGQQQGNHGNAEDLLTNANIEKFLNDPKTIDLLTKIQSTPKNGGRTGNTAVRSRKVNNNGARVNRSMQINTDDMGHNDYKIFPNSNRTSDLVLRQLAMYLNQNTAKTPEVGINTHIPQMESSATHQHDKKNVDKARATSCVKTPNNYLSNKERFRPKYIDSIINRSLNMSPQRTTPMNKASNVQAKTPVRTAGNENMVSNLIGFKTNELGATTMKPKPAPLAQLERVMTPDSGARVKTPKLMHEEGRVSSSRVIRGIYRIRDSSMMSFDDKSEGDMSQEDDTKTKSLSTQPDKEQKLDGDVRSSLEVKLPNKKIAHRRLFSSVHTDRKILSQTSNTPSASRTQESKRENNLSFTHTSGFTSPETKMNRTMMEGFQRTWEDSKRQILQGKVKDATFLNFEQRGGGKIQSRSKGGAFTLAIRRPLFEGEKTPGPGDYRVKVQMNKTAFAFGRDRKFDILGLPFVNEVNKRYDPTRYI